MEIFWQMRGLYVVLHWELHWELGVALAAFYLLPKAELFRFFVFLFSSAGRWTQSAEGGGGGGDPAQRFFWI
jgi:hypothetical protein